MGTPHPPEESILFVAILYSNNDLADRVLSILGGKYGDVLIESPEYPWDHSDYYDEEIGSPIFRRFIFYRKPFDPLTLPDVKLETNAIEHEYSVNGKRLVNIDPGYLMSSRVVLASARGYMVNFPCIIKAAVINRCRILIRTTSLIPQSRCSARQERNSKR